MSELHEGQRVQLNLAKMPAHRREVYARNGNGVVAGFVNERVWVEFDDGRRALFWIDELEPAVEQIGMFVEVAP